MAQTADGNTLVPERAGDAVGSEVVGDIDGDNVGDIDGDTVGHRWLAHWSATPLGRR